MVFAMRSAGRQGIIARPSAMRHCVPRNASLSTYSPLFAMKQFNALKARDAGIYRAGSGILAARQAPVAAIEGRNAERALYQLDLSRGNGTVFTLKDVHTVLEQSNGLAWEVITGRVFDNKVERLDGLDDKQRAAVELCRIHGIGKVKADKYIQAGLRSLVDVLKECQKKDRKVDIPHAVHLGAYYMDDIEQLIPRVESIEWQKILDAACEKADKNLKGYILGSYRRESPYSSDIDYVLYHPDIKMDSKESECKRMMSKFVEQIDEPYVVGQLSFGDKQFQGIIRMSPTSVARRIDINLGTADHFGCKMLASTGDDRLQKIIRGKAKDMNLFLNDIAIGPRVPHHSGTASHFKKDELIETPEEKDIFKLLELPWLEPKQRNFGYYSKLPEYRALIDKGY